MMMTMGYSKLAAWFHMVWWRITMVYTALRALRYGVPVQTATELAEIPARLSWGNEYKRDKGRGDFFTHPRVVQARINGDTRVGDCEDHAGYWAAVLIKSKLADRVWLGTVGMKHENGSIDGHAVVLFTKGGILFVADYGLPRQVGVSPGGANASLKPNNWAWAQVVASEFGAIPYGAAEIDIERTKWDGLRLMSLRTKRF